MARTARSIILFCTYVIIISLSSITRTKAQDEESLLDLISDSTAEETEYISYAFKSTRITNGGSIEMLGAGSLDFRVLHRFGPISQGVEEFFGLDQASTRLSFDYAPINDLLIGIGRSSVKKEIDGSLKYRLLQQSRGARTMPATVVLVAGMTCQTLPWSDTSRPNYFSSRLGYFFQTHVGSKLSEDLSLQLSPTLVHQNLVEEASDPNDIFALGIGGRIRITNRMSFTFEYYHAFNGMVEDVNYDPFALGIDIETGGHVFQIHVSNASGMNERAFITETYNSWKDIRLGFNLSRVFQL